MRKSNAFLQALANIVMLTGLGGCGSLVENLAGIETVAGALSFSADPRSGDKSKTDLVLTIVPFAAAKAEYAAYQDAVRRAASDEQFAQILRVCAPEPPRPRDYRYASLPTSVFNPAGAVTAVGNLVVDAAFEAIQSRIDELKKRNSADYSIKRAWEPGAVIKETDSRAPEWDNIHCMIVQRVAHHDGSGPAAMPYRRIVAPRNAKMTVVLQRRPFGRGTAKSGSILTPIYSLLNTSVAETGVAQGPKKAKVKLSITTIISTISSDKGKTTVSESVNQSLNPVMAPLGELAEVCAPWTSKSNPLETPICAGGTSLFANPPAKSPMQVNILFSEAGSALSDAEAAAKALAKIKEATKSPVSDLLKALTAGLN